MTPSPAREFGKRQPRLTPDEPPAIARKRSSGVALLLMGTMALGGGAYALMPHENCDPNQTPPAAGQPADCRQRSSSSSSHGIYGTGSSSHSNFVGSEISSGHAAGSAAPGGASQVVRGGFGSFMSHLSGGG